ncbi:hypothetical protein GCM10010349_58130 [Streptomyces flavofungini]|nr:hypothetical protein GCM10010349_58130 [Streptomyces flavofungini]
MAGTEKPLGDHGLDLVDDALCHGALRRGGARVQIFHSGSSKSGAPESNRASDQTNDRAYDEDQSFWAIDSAE